MKIGFDIHGVLDKDPELFKYIINALRQKGHEVHVITGREINDDLLKELDELRIPYDYLFSITSYHKSIGTYITYKNDDPTQPLIAPPKWDRTKGEYAKEVGLDIHIDDSEVYGDYFPKETNYVIFTEAVYTLLRATLDAGATAFWN